VRRHDQIEAAAHADGTHAAKQIGNQNPGPRHPVHCHQLDVFAETTSHCPSCRSGARAQIQHPPRLTLWKGNPSQDAPERRLGSRCNLGLVLLAQLGPGQIGRTDQLTRTYESAMNARLARAHRMVLGD
jgi:hypothetical protein